MISFLEMIIFVCLFCTLYLATLLKLFMLIVFFSFVDVVLQTDHLFL